MKRHRVEILVILTASIGLSLIFPGFFTESAMVIVWNGVTNFAITSVIVFILITLLYFGGKPPADKDTNRENAIIGDGYQELYNENNQITKKGFFEGGRLSNGTRYVYRKDGSLLRVETYKNGVHTGDELKSI
jgi:hypothetical protein